MKKPYIVGISGKSAGGKTSFAYSLKDKLPEFRIKLISMDAYYKEAEERPIMKGIVNNEQYIDDNHPDALNFEHFHADVRNAAEETWDVILLEGIFSLWDEYLVPLLDLKIYVDCNSEERFARRVKRHMTAGEEMDAVINRYVQAVTPRQTEYVENSKWHSDIIINGFGMPSVGTDIVLTWIRQYLSLHG